MEAEAGLPAYLIWTGVAVLLLLSGLLAVLASLLERSGSIRRRHWADEAGGGLQRLNESPADLAAFRYLLSFLARVAPLVLFVVLYGTLRGGWLALLEVALWLALVEGLNRVLVGRDPESALRWLTRPYRVALALLAPLVRLLAPLLGGPATDRKEDEDEVSEEEIEAFIDVGTREGILDPGEDDLIMRVIDFGDAVVKSVITPRIDMVAAPSDTSLEALADLFLDAKHTRIPLYRESVDQVVGVLHLRELLAGLRSPLPQSAAELAMPPYVVPETKPLNELLREFQSSRQQLAIVVDEFGGTVGLVTVEDLLEEIVGEIVDEHEEVPESSQELPDGSWKLDGATPLDTLHMLFGVDVDEEPVETVGGLVFGRLGRLPETGQRIEAFGLELVVRRVEGRRIKSVTVRPVGDVAGAGE
ncbi:MAG: hemolysin family protein [Thermoanaerobaculia bacterium]